MPARTRRRVGGGVDTHNVLTMKVTASAPLFGPGPSDRLLNQPDGANPAPTGWRASLRNDDTRNLAFKVVAICAPLSGANTVVGSNTVSAGSHRGEQVKCRRAPLPWAAASTSIMC
jgi:hypothetical protein